ncbi:MAG: hypothetical protein ABSF69_27970 [Polyangiaceae bacterium]|jgi:hypothetical protein
MSPQDWEATRQHKAEAVRAMYVPLEPGETLTFRQSFDDYDSFRSYYPPDSTGYQDEKLRVASGVPCWGHNVNGKQATVIRHLPWDGVHPFNRSMDRANFDDPYDSEPNFEWYEVDCEGERLYAGRWHTYRTEEELQRDEEANATLDALVAEIQRETELDNNRS